MTVTVKSIANQNLIRHLFFFAVDHADYSECNDALTHHFDPDNKRVLQIIELQHRKKRQK